MTKTQNQIITSLRDQIKAEKEMLKEFEDLESKGAEYPDVNPIWALQKAINAQKNHIKTLELILKELKKRS